MSQVIGLEHIFRNKKFFVICMVVSSMLPFFVGVTLSFFISPDISGIPAILMLIIMGLGAHQVTTAYFYVDEYTLPLIKRNWRIYLLNPLLIVTSVTVIMFLWGHFLFPYLLALLSAWTIYHYQKQNVGIFSLMSPLISSMRITPIEKRLIIMSGVSGILAFGDPIGNPWFHNTIFEGLGSIAFFISIVILIGVMIIFFITLLKRMKMNEFSRTFVFRDMLLFLFLIFYTPLYFIDNPLLAFAIPASAHGIQYFFVMIFIASDGSVVGLSRFQRFKTLKLLFSLLTLAFVTLFLWYLWTETRIAGELSTSSSVKYTLISMAISFSFVHYYLDGKIWKLSNSEVRTLMKKKLDFIM